MKFIRTFISLSSLAMALAAVIVTVHYVARASDAKVTLPAIHVDTTPVDRSPASGNSYGPIVKKVAPSVVNIYSTRFIKQRVYGNPAEMLLRQMFGNQVPDNSREYTRRYNWLGSGMIVTPDGYILTANHVVADADEVEVGTSDDKVQYPAKIIGTDPATDIAVLKIDAHDLPAIGIGDSSQLEVGDVVLAIGNPFGVGQTVTRGIVSALGRSLSSDDDESPSQRHYQDFIQTDASINQGNSGGALVDAQGRLIGINDAIVSPSGTSAGIGFAVPINLARSVMEGFLNGGRVARGFLGVDLQDIDAGLAKSLGVSASGGALITEVGDSTPASAAGLKSGDVVISVNDQPVSGVENLKVIISQIAPGTQAALKVVRDGAESKINVTLGENTRTLNASAPTKPVEPAPTNPPAADALAGVFVQDLDTDFRQQLVAPLVITGAVVTGVDSASNSSVAGLRRGDVILEIDRQPVATAKDAKRLGRAAKGDQILIKVWRRTGDQTAAMRYLSVSNTHHAS